MALGEYLLLQRNNSGDNSDTEAKSVDVTVDYPWSDDGPASLVCYQHAPLGVPRQYVLIGHSNDEYGGINNSSPRALQPLYLADFDEVVVTKYSRNLTVFASFLQHFSRVDIKSVILESAEVEVNTKLYRTLRAFRKGHVQEKGLNSIITDNHPNRYTLFLKS